MVAQDSANINASVEHDYVSNMIKGGDQTHCLATLSPCILIGARSLVLCTLSLLLIDTLLSLLSFYLSPWLAPGCAS